MNKFLIGFMLMMLVTSAVSAQVANEGDLQPLESKVFVENSDDVKFEKIMKTVNVAVAVAQSVFAFNDPYCGSNQTQVNSPYGETGTVIQCYTGNVPVYGWYRVCAYCPWRAVPN